MGFALGVYLGSVISARYGRRMTVFTMSLWALVSATIVITSRTKEQMLIARILNYIYIVRSSPRSLIDPGFLLPLMAIGDGAVGDQRLPSGNNARCCSRFRCGVISDVNRERLRSASGWLEGSPC